MSERIRLGVKKTGDNIRLGVGGKLSGVNDYEMLTNKPSINGVTVSGDKLGGDYRLQGLMASITPQDIDLIIYGG